MSRAVRCLSRSSSTTFASSGDKGPPCGSPSGVGCRTPSISTPARRIPCLTGAGDCRSGGDSDGVGVSLYPGGRGVIVLYAGIPSSRELRIQEAPILCTLGISSKRLLKVRSTLSDQHGRWLKTGLPDAFVARSSVSTKISTRSSTTGQEMCHIPGNVDPRAPRDTDQGGGTRSGQRCADKPADA
jgi:hypothetical protein